MIFFDFGQNPDFSHDFAWQKKPSENSHRSNHFASHYIIIRLKPTVAPNSAPCLTHSLQFFTIKKENITEIKRKIGKNLEKKIREKGTSKLRSQAPGKQFCWLFEQNFDLFATFDWKKMINESSSSRLFWTKVCLKSQKNKSKERKMSFSSLDMVYGPLQKLDTLGISFWFCNTESDSQFFHFFAKIFRKKFENSELTLLRIQWLSKREILWVKKPYLAFNDWSDKNLASFVNHLKGTMVPYISMLDVQNPSKILATIW